MVTVQSVEASGVTTLACLVCCVLQAYIEEFLRQREEKKAAALAAARAEDQKIKQYWSMVSCLAAVVTEACFESLFSYTGSHVTAWPNHSAWSQSVVKLPLQLEPWCHVSCRCLSVMLLRQPARQHASQQQTASTTSCGWRRRQLCAHRCVTASTGCGPQLHAQKKLSE